MIHGRWGEEGWLPVRGLIAGRDMLPNRYARRLVTTMGNSQQDRVRAILSSSLSVRDCLPIDGDPDIIFPSLVPIETIVALFRTQILPHWPHAVVSSLNSTDVKRSIDYLAATGDIVTLRLSEYGIQKWIAAGSPDGNVGSFAVYRY